MKHTTQRSGKLLLAALLVCVLLCSCAFPVPSGIFPDDSSDAFSLSGSQNGEKDGEDSEPEGEGDLFAPDYQPQAEGVCLVNEDTGIVVYEKNADAPFTAASLVKMMTCILTAERCTDLDGETVVSDKTWIYDELYGKNASTADIRKGETLTVRELLYAALLPSANEAALLLADYVSGGYMENFLYMMNTRAEKLGCTGTHFADANGLSEESVTTARDTALITRAFMRYPVLVEIASTPSYEMAAHEGHAAPYYITSTNRLLATASPYYNAFSASAGCVVAGKTGSLGEWQNFASMAEKDGESYICAILHSPNTADVVGPGLDPPQARPALYEAAALYDWAFKNLGVRATLDVTQPVTEIPVKYSTEQGTVRLLPAGDIKTVLPLSAGEAEIKRIYDLPESLSAPVEKGQKVGGITLIVDGQVIGTTDLLAEQDVPRNNTLFALRKVGEFFSSVYVRVVLVILVLAVAAYIGIVILLSRHKKKTLRRAPPGQQGANRRSQPAPPKHRR